MQCIQVGMDLVLNHTRIKLSGTAHPGTTICSQFCLLQSLLLKNQTRKNMFSRRGALGPKTQQTHTHAHPFNGPLSGTTRVRRHQKRKTNRDFTEATDSEWQWHLLGYMQVCTSLQADNHTSTPPLSFLQAGCPSCRPTNSVKALKAHPNTQQVSLSGSTDL